MTTGGTDRLDRIEAILERVALQQEENARQIRDTRAIADSNARSIQAWESRIEDGIAEAEEVSTSMAANINEQLSTSIADTVAMIGELGRQQGETMRQQAETDQRFNVLLEEARADRQEWRQKFDKQVAEMQSDRQSNANQFEAALELIRGLFLEIQELWREFRAG